MNRKHLYLIYGIVFQVLTLSATLASLFFLYYLLQTVFLQGVSFLNWNFLTGYPSRFPNQAGILSATVGTIYTMVLTAFFAVPMGVGAAIYLEEYARDSWFIRIVKMNIQNLSGVPSIVYGILGLALFVRGFGLEIFGIKLGFGRSILAGSLTMAIVILPIITIAAQESLRAVPDSFRLAGFGIGMTRWQVVRYQVMPLALPGMLTGIILAMSRAIGESAPLILVGALAFVPFLPESLFDSFTVLPIQIYNWVARPQKGFHDISASAIIVLIALLILLNAIAILLRNYFAHKLKDINH